jgi:RHH-type rel operon transcriptional repressor/antitoxin RelB
MNDVISVRLPEDLKKALEILAKATDRPKTYLVRKAIEAYLGEYADYEIALERLRDKDDAILSSGELKKKLGL